MTKKKFKTMFRMVIAFVLLLSMMVIPADSYKSNAVNTTVYAAATTSTPNYITARAFIKRLVVAMNLDVDTSKKMPYVTAALHYGLLEQGEIENLDANITRTDCAVLLDRADEYLHGETLEDDFIQTILDKRISDIKKVAKSKREAVASVYGKGIIRGYSNGVAVQSREFRGDNYVTVKSAKNFINLTVNTKGRSKLSPDGQLIRTTNLPKNADKYEYILESFPNSFYEMKFYFQRYNQWKEATQTVSGFTLNEDYCYPEYIRNFTYKNFYEEYPMSEVMDEYLDTWMERAEAYVYNIFNVDYRTSGDEWVDSVIESLGISTQRDVYEKALNHYLADMKKYKTIVKSSVVSVEPSTFYSAVCTFYVRVFVKFKISATSIPEDQSDLVYSGVYTEFNNLKLNTWQTITFDLEFVDLNGFTGKGESMYPTDTTEIFSPS